MKNVVLAALLTLAASPVLAFPVTVDSCGKPLTFNAPPKRAVVHEIGRAHV